MDAQESGSEETRRVSLLKVEGVRSLCGGVWSMQQVWRESATSLPHRYPNEEKSFAIFSITILSVRNWQWEFQP